MKAILKVIFAIFMASMLLGASADAGLGARRSLLAGKRCYAAGKYYKHSAWTRYNGLWYRCCNGLFTRGYPKKTKLKCL